MVNFPESLEPRAGLGGLLFRWKDGGEWEGGLWLPELTALNSGLPMGCRVGSRGGQVGVFPGDTLSRFIWAGPQAKDLQEALRTAAPLLSLGHFWEVWGGWSLPEEDRVCKRKPVTFTCSGHSEWICGELQSGPVGARRPGQLSQFGRKGPGSSKC